MIPVLVYNQRDMRWRNEPLGFAPVTSHITIGTDGCALASAAMVGNFLTPRGFVFTPLSLQAELKKIGGFAPNRQGYKTLIIWARVAEIYGIRYIGSANYNNWKASWLVNVRGIPLIVEGSAPEIGAVQHFRVFVGGRMQADPWTGKIVSTSKYAARSIREFAR